MGAIESKSFVKKQMIEGLINIHPTGAWFVNRLYILQEL